MGRYNELFEYQIAKNNIEVLNMLNTKYFIIQNSEGQEEVQQNPDANGNTWFVEKLKLVKTADAEIQALDSLNTKKEAVIDTTKLQKGINKIKSNNIVQNYDNSEQKIKNN